MAKQPSTENKYISIIGSVAGTAAAACEGVASVSTEPGSLLQGFSRRASKKSSVNVEILGNNCYIDISINARYGAPLPELIATLQEKVKTEVEKATFYRVKSVNINIVGVVF